jgi:uncharacterized damage-inducible protein DinB
MHSDDALRGHLRRLLDWSDAHVSFDEAVAAIPAEARLKRASFPHSCWELLEHLRITQLDILEFCRDPGYRELRWPDDYWPDRSPPTDEQWESSVDAFQRHRNELMRLVAEQPDLYAAIPHGSGQTYLREILLVADHNAYHIGQLVALRRALGIWRS